MPSMIRFKNIIWIYFQGFQFSSPISMKEAEASDKAKPVTNAAEKNLGMSPFAFGSSANKSPMMEYNFSTPPKPKPKPSKNCTFIPVYVNGKWFNFALF